jgi:hypothetical protein
MALSESQIQARIDAIRAARDAGVLMTRHGDTSTQFRSLAEMDKIISSLEAELASLQGVTKKRVHYIAQCGKGL